jgi:hypothetical protein
MRTMNTNPESRFDRASENAKATGALMSSEAAAAFWADLKRALHHVKHLRQPPSWRRRRTGEMRVTVTERRAMQAFHLLHTENYTALARRFRRDRHYMPRWIWGDPDYRAFHAYYRRTYGP